MTDAPKIFTTSDIAIAAYLAIHGYVLRDCRVQHGGRFYFEYDDPDSTARSKSI